MHRAYIHASEVLTGSGVRKKKGRRVLEEDLGRIPDGAIVYTVEKRGRLEIPKKIEWVGPTQEFPKNWSKVKKIDLRQKKSIIPGMIDCHNHLVFAGDRSDEFAARCGGATYQEIAAKGGGIQSTVRATREASPKELEDLGIQRLQELYAYGVRTVEIKSGYGLSTESELKILKIISKLKKKFPQITLTSTFLGAHAFPKDQTRQEYLNELLEVMLPQVAKEKLADSCDVFIDEGYYSLEEGRRILLKAKDLGLKVKVHADELFNTESASMAAEIGALSADHLLKISDQGIQNLARSETVAVLLPGTAFYLKAPYAPARKLIDSGAVVALATDFNPGTCMCLSLPTIMTLAALYLGMTRAELFAAVTYNAAQALDLAHCKGTLEAGLDADFAVLPFARFEEIYYRFAWSV
jgi:imidazolonepropionase